MAVTTGTALLGGAIAGSSVLGGMASNKAAKAQVGAANEASRLQRDMFTGTRQDNMPWMQAGQGGLNALMQLYGMQSDGNGGYTQSSDPQAAMRMLQQDPSYQFRLQQGQGALENSAAARGGLMSGNMLRALSDYGQNTASMEFGNVANRLAGLAGAGQNTAQYLGGIGQNAGQALANNTMMAGQARASGYTGMANALNNAVGQGAMLYGMRG